MSIKYLLASLLIFTACVEEETHTTEESDTVDTTSNIDLRSSSGSDGYFKLCKVGPNKYKTCFQRPNQPDCCKTIIVNSIQ